MRGLGCAVGQVQTLPGYKHRKEAHQRVTPGISGGFFADSPIRVARFANGLGES